MKTNLKRVLSFVLVMMLILSCVPAVAFAAEDNSACAAQNITTGAEYDSLAEAMEAAASGETVKVLADSDAAVTYTAGVILDLNGHNVSNVTVPQGITLTAIDSATDDYEGAFGSLTTDGNVAATVKTTGDVKSYVAIADNGSWSFHRYYAAITAISLKPASAALGYKAEFYGDEAVKNAVVNYGYEMWLNDYAPKAMSKANKLEKNVLTLRLNNILRQNNDAMNDLGSTATIGGKAFITLNLNGEEVTLYSADQTTTLRKTIESINSNVAAYSETALQAVRNLCTTYAPWMMGWATENIFGIGAGDTDLDVEVLVPITAENNVVTAETVVENDNIIVTIPAGVQLADGTDNLVLTIVDKASSDSDVEAAEGEALRPLDVHIEGISADNITPVIICLGNVLPKGLNIGNYDLYHVEDGQTVTMTLVNSISELDAHNEFCYDPATGAVTVAVCSFSEIALTNTAAVWAGNFADFSGAGTENDPYIIANADQLAQMSKLVSTDEAYATAHYRLITDLDFGGYSNTVDENDVPTNVFYPIGYWKQQDGVNAAGEVYYGFGNAFQGVFDGYGNTVANLCQRTWDMNGNYDNGYWDDAMGLFGATFNATIKNLTIDNFQSDGEFTPTGCVAAYAGGTSTFENITLINCNPRVYNTGNGGIVGLNYNSSTEGKVDNLVFRNITVDQTNKITALWGSWDVGCGGILGRLRDDEAHPGELNTATFENCYISPIIDVYNDVCANYQYYQYRYCGMLIGTVDYVDLANFDVNQVVKASNTYVTYGDWNEYWYCELVANSLASYTHDHQFSRLTKISGVSDIQDAQGNWTKAGNFVIPATNEQDAVCYHIVNKDGVLTQHKHEDAGYETINGVKMLKEDRQHYYIPFGQLFTGYGWGSSMRDTFEGVKINESDTVKSTQKFNSKNVSGVQAGEIAIGDLFALTVSVDKLSASTLQVFVSPADEKSTVSGSFSADLGNWENGKLTLSGSGMARITITDYYYCTATTIIVPVAYGVNGLTNHSSGWTAKGIYISHNAHSAQFGSDWSVEYKPVAADAIKLVRGGETLTVGQPASGTLVVYSSTEMYLKTETWTIQGNVLPLQDQDYLIVEGSFVHEASGNIIDIEKTYIYNHEGNLKFSTTPPAVFSTVEAGHMKSHVNGMSGNGIKFMMDSNAAPYKSDWSLEYTQTSVDCIKLIRDGVVSSIGIVGRPLIVKYSDTEYYLKLEGWTVGQYGLNNQSNPITSDDVLIIEGRFVNDANKVRLDVSKTYVYHDGNGWVCSAEAPANRKIVNVADLDRHSNGWVSGGVYFSAAENDAPYDGWSLRYKPVSADVIKRINPDGTVTNVGNTGGETIVKYSTTEYYIEGWTIGGGNTLVAGNTIVIEGLFYNSTSKTFIDVEKTYITFNSDGSVTVGKTMLPYSADSLTIGMWNGSYHVFEDAQLEKLQAAGITKIMGINTQWIGTEDVNAWLDRVYGYGISVIFDLRDWDGTTVPAYANHPGVLGFLMYDEPKATEFDNLAALKTKFDAVMPADKLFYVNLFPECAADSSLDDISWWDKLLGNSPDYDEDYVSKFLSKLNVQVLSWDNYSLISQADDPSLKGIRRDYFHNFEVMASKNKTMWYTMLSAGHTSGAENTIYKTPTAEELRWQMAVAMTYGVRNIDHYVYASHEDGYTTMVEYDTWTPTGLYFDIFNVDNEYLLWDNIYTAYNWVGVGTYSANSNNSMLTMLENTLSLANYGVSVSADQNLLVGVFDHNGEKAYMVTNAGSTTDTAVGDGKSFSMANASVTLTLSESGYEYVAVIDKGQISYVEVNNNSVTLDVEAYEGVFVIPVKNG